MTKNINLHSGKRAFAPSTTNLVGDFMSPDKFGQRTKSLQQRILSHSSVVRGFVYLRFLCIGLLPRNLSVFLRV
jgi:hypothetical protein